VRIIRVARPSAWLFARLLLLGWLLGGAVAAAAKVTLITHGLNGATTGWVAGMAQALTNRPGGPTDAAIYRLQISSSNNTLSGAFTRLSGSPVTNSASGEIILLLDWGPVAGGNSFNTLQVAAAVLPFLTATNALPELGGRALVEWPLHLIGHSRGGSLVCELSRRLGEQGVWVDHVTTLDAHPLNNDGFNDFIYSAVDATAKTYENVLFADSYWQNTALVRGLAVPGAYARRQTNFSGGYSDPFSGPHSDIHLWYHATIALQSPVSDTEATISASDRQLWFVTAEQRGTNAGFHYSLREPGDRRSAAQPGGTTSNRVRDGFNQRFDLGLGVAGNRTALTNNLGLWPNVIRFDLLITHVSAPPSATAQIYFQWARPATSNATISVWLDADLNPHNGNEQLLVSGFVSGTTASQVGRGDIELPLTNAAPGSYRVLARLTAPDGRTRFLHAPQWLNLTPAPEPPTLDLTMLTETTLALGVNAAVGQTVVLESSTNLAHWSAWTTQTLATARWQLTVTNDGGAQFFRARAVP